jgi:hypothetical protein
MATTTWVEFISESLQLPSESRSLSELRKYLHTGAFVQSVSLVRDSTLPSSRSLEYEVTVQAEQDTIVLRIEHSDAWFAWCLEHGIRMERASYEVRRCAQILRDRWQIWEEKWGKELFETCLGQLIKQLTPPETSAGLVMQRMKGAANVDNVSELHLWVLRDVLKVMARELEQHFHYNEREIAEIMDRACTHVVLNRQPLEGADTLKIALLVDRN